MMSTWNFFRKNLVRLPQKKTQNKRTENITLVGYARGDFGVAENLRCLSGSLDAVSRRFNVYEVGAGGVYSETDNRLVSKLVTQVRDSLEIICVNADQTRHVVSGIKYVGSRRNYRVGIWFWELERFPQVWMPAFNYIDEVWAPSRFIFDNLVSISPKPVFQIPIAVEFSVTGSRESTRIRFGLPADKFIFMFSFDLLSFPSRKNHIAVIDAFRMAFPAEKDVCLVIKISNSSGSRELFNLSNYPDNLDERIIIIDEVLSRSSMYCLLDAIDCYVSLHRSEGFGLGMAEAMFLGKPVIATGYSGNLSFMTPKNSCLVGYDFVDVREGEYPHWEGQRWASADLGEAAAYMRRIKGDPAFREKIAVRGQNHIKRMHSYRAVGEAVNARLEQIDNI